MSVFNQDPGVEGLILFKHGIFTFGETAKIAYDRMIGAVSRAERRLKKGAVKRILRVVNSSAKVASTSTVAPILRGLAVHKDKPLLLEFRTSKKILDFFAGPDLNRYSQPCVAVPYGLALTSLIQT